MIGHIKALRSTYGFITAESGQEFFFHAEDEIGDVELQVGDRVSFEVVEPRPAKGPRARDVAWSADERSHGRRWRASRTRGAVHSLVHLRNRFAGDAGKEQLL